MSPATELGKLFIPVGTALTATLAQRVVRTLSEPRPVEEVAQVGTPEEISAALDAIAQFAARNPGALHETITSLSADHVQFFEGILEQYGTPENQAIIIAVIEGRTRSHIELIRTLQNIAIAGIASAAALGIAAILKPTTPPPPLTFGEWLFGREQR